MQSACDNTEHHRALFCGSDSLLFNGSTLYILILDQPAGALKKPCRHPSRTLLLIEVLPRIYDRDLNNSVTPSLPVDFPLSWNFNLISPKFFLPIIRGTFLLIRFIIVSGTLSLFYLSLLICTYLSRVQNWSRASGLCVFVLNWLSWKPVILSKS